MKTFTLFTAACLLFPFFAYSGEPIQEIAPSASSQKETGPDLSKISEAFGHLIGKNLESFHVELDNEALLRGLKNALAGIPSPMEENDCIAAISQIQQVAFEQLAEQNLAVANAFMEENSKEKDVVIIEKGKLHYKEQAAGSGPAVCEHGTALIRYKGSFKDGTIFGASSEDETISLDETITGFAKGMVGMQEGSKRILYVHPEMAYGTTGILPPNSLLVFEVEVVKSHIPPEEKHTLSGLSEPKNIIG